MGKSNPNLTFLGHTDTVSYSNWKYAPFKVTIENGNLYGLGVCDMKGGISAFLTAITNIDLKKLKRGIQIVLTFDEEKSFEGIKLLTNHLNLLSKNILIGEPTDLIPVIGTKGCIEYKITFTGKGTHFSNVVDGVNAIVECNKFINDLLKYSEELKKEQNSLFNIPYTTMNIGIINGGSVINIVPDKCELVFDFRTIDKKQHEIIKDQVLKLVNKYDAILTEITNVYPSGIKNENIKFYENLTNKKVTCFNYVTEASFLDKSNNIILGPGPNTSHEKDEYISIDSYDKTIKIYEKIIRKYCE